MGEIDGLSPEWKAWIHENLERGCHVSTIVETMIGSRFDPATAVGSVLREARQLPSLERHALAEERELPSAWKQWALDKIDEGFSAKSVLDELLIAGLHPISSLVWVFSEAAKRNRIEEELALLKQSQGDNAIEIWGRNSLKSDGPVQTPQAPSHSGADYNYDKPRLTHQGNVIRTNDRIINVRLRLERPVIAVFDNVLSDEECEELIRLARNSMAPSTVVERRTGKSRMSRIRTSSGTFLRDDTSGVTQCVNRRIAELMQMPMENGEDLQILHYQAEQEYKPHHDYFDPFDTSTPHLLARGGQRVSTLVMYLNDVARGGETAFPDLGLSVSPRKGSAVYFEYCNDLGQLDQKTLHAGAPVLEGEKWAATKWMRYRRFG